jgi:hypothetical protein
MQVAVPTSPNKTQSEKKSSHEFRIGHETDWVNCPLTLRVNGLGTKKKILKEPSTPHVTSLEKGQWAETTRVSILLPKHANPAPMQVDHTRDKEFLETGDPAQKTVAHLGSARPGAD